MLGSFGKLGRLGLTGGKSLAAKIMAMSPKLWLEPSTANYQDRAGTTPVTAPGTAADAPVGLVLDKSQGLVLGPELVTNGDMSSATGWGGDSTAAITGGVLNVGAMTGNTVQQSCLTVGKWYKLVFSVTRFSVLGTFRVRLGGGGSGDILPGISGVGTYTVYGQATINADFVILRYATSDFDIDNISVRELPGNHAYQATSTARPVLSARKNLLLATDTLATQNVTTVAGPYTIQFSGAGSVTASGTYSGALTSGQTFTATDGTLTLTVSGSVTSAQLETGSSATAYQSVVSASNYDGAFPKYWKFDGVDDALATGNIDLTGTDKITVVAGVQNASSAVYQNPYGNGAANAPGTQGKFTLSYPSGAANQARGDFGGVSAVNAPAFSITAAPTVVTQILDSTTSPYQTIRSNGAIVATGWEDVGGQSFANAAIGMGSTVYGGGANPYAGRVYALLIFPRILTAPEIATVEQYVAQLTGVTL